MLCYFVEEKISLEDRVAEFEKKLHDQLVRSREELDSTRRSLDVYIQTLRAVFAEALPGVATPSTAEEFSKMLGPGKRRLLLLRLMQLESRASRMTRLPLR